MSKEELQISGLMWSMTDLLRGVFKPSEYGSVLFPFIALRRLECLREEGEESLRLLASNRLVTAAEMRHYLETFPSEITEVLKWYGFYSRLDRLADSGLLWRLVSVFADLDLRPEVVSNHEMDDLFGQLVQDSAERSPEMAGEHYTPPDVSQLVAGLLVAPGTASLRASGTMPTVLDPACGTGRLLSAVEDEATRQNPNIGISIAGQDFSSETWALCRLWMMLSGRDPQAIRFGDTFSDDRYPGEKFDYLVSNPPYGIEWRRSAADVHAEHLLGMSGRFGAGLPRINDGSLLFLQHMLSKMKPTGSRIAIVFSAAPMWTGSAGSGESEIRRWIIENDWLESVVALPAGIQYNTSIQTYIWTLTNKKSADRRGKIVLVDAVDLTRHMRKPLGSKNRYFSSEQIDQIIRAHREALSAVVEPEHPLHEKVRLLHNEELGYRQILVEEPLRLRFELAQDALDKLMTTRVMNKVAEPERLIEALRPLIGSVWSDETEAITRLERAVAEFGVTLPPRNAFRKALRDVIWTRDPQSPVVERNGELEPDVELRSLVSLPLDVNPDDYLREKVLPTSPDAWINHSRTRLGYAIPTNLFSRPSLATRFAPLNELVSLGGDRISDNSELRYLGAVDLHSIKPSVELPEIPDTTLKLTVCRDGDLVGRHGNWRLLPFGFGEAATSLSVLRLKQGSGRTLCEWLNSRDASPRFPVTNRDLETVLVPIDLVLDSHVDSLLEDVQSGRQRLHEATTNLLPNVFAGKQRDVPGLLAEMSSVTAQARLVGELVRPLVDPVGQAEWTYPFHVAALARRYRIATDPAERRDALLKLGEGIARVVGILALSELVSDGRMSRKVRNEFYGGATFGTWLKLIDKFVQEVNEPRMLELAELKKNIELRTLLMEIKEFRNSFQHAHGVRADHELEAEVDRLEPQVMSAITAGSWLSGMRWDLVELCAYRDHSSYRHFGQMLRGSHPRWEPFDRPSTYPLRPDRIYTGSTKSGVPVDLWPLVAVELCQVCATRELFLINEVNKGVAVLRSLEEHTISIPLPTEPSGQAAAKGNF